MSETDMIQVGEPLPRLSSVVPADDHLKIRVTWGEGARIGRTDVIDLAPMILIYKVFRPLRQDPALFRTVHLGSWGSSIVWDGDADLDIGADSLEELAEETMSSTDFAAFLKRHRLSLDAAAALLGLSRRVVAYYAKERHVPRHVALACRYLDLTRGEAAGPSADASERVAASPAVA